MATVDYPTTSCSVMSSGGLANGLDPGSMAPPTARLPPRMVTKGVWSEGPEAGRDQSQPEEQTWNSRQDHGPEAWSTGRDRPPDQVWSSGRDRAGHSGQEEVWMPGRDGAHPGPDQAWMLSREQGWAAGPGPGQGQNQAWAGGRDSRKDRTTSGLEQGWGTSQSQEQTWSTSIEDRGNIWRPGRPSHTQRVTLSWLSETFWC